VSQANYKNILNLVCEHYKDLSDNQKEYSKSRMFNDTKNYLVDNILSLSDKSSMAASVEGRFPLIDYRIAELAFSLPADFTVNEKIPKVILKKLSEKYIPNEILNRKKEGFNAPIQQWFAESQVKEILAYVQKGVNERLSDIINPIEFEKIISKKRNSEMAFENVYNLYFLIKWMENNEH
jgi:asparagine synthase (glutamine-hydrolysing)